MRIRFNLGRIAPRWRVLEQEQRNAWTLAGQDADIRHRLGRAVPLTGFQFFLNQFFVVLIGIGVRRSFARSDMFIENEPWNTIQALSGAAWK
jgi:hypothetical protein